MGFEIMNFDALITTLQRQVSTMGALDGEVPVAPVNCKKYQCCMTLSLIYAHIACRFQEVVMSLVIIFF